MRDLLGLHCNWFRQRLSEIDTLVHLQLFSWVSVQWEITGK